MKQSFRLALLVSAAALLPLAAHAQTFTRLVSFGDSLSDNGNLYTATGNPPAPYNKRYTNDQVWAEYIAGTMQSYFGPASSVNTGSVDYAWGGARSDLAANSNGPIPGTPAQIAAFRAKGGTFGAGDVVSMWAGANDIFQALPGAATNPSTAASVMTSASVTAAGNVATQVGTLAGYGAKTIVVFNLPDLGQTPQFNTDPSASGLATVSATAFNTALHAGLTSVAASATGSNIVEVDIKSAFTAIIANPAAFGLANASKACLTVTACVTGGASAQNTYLFWDGVHPTASGHKLVAQIAAQYLYTPTLAEGAGALADESYNTRRQNLSDTASLFHGGRGYFVQAVGQDASKSRNVSQQGQIGAAATTGSQKAYDYTVGGFRAGAVTAVSDNTAFGIAVTAVTGESKAFLVSAKPTDLSIDAGFDWSHGPAFLTAQVGGSLGQFADYERQTLVGAFRESRNQIDVSSVSAAIQGGLDHHLGGWTVTPVARLAYIAADMKGFAEQGTVAAVSFEDRKVSSFNGAVELRAAGTLSETTGLNAVIGYEAAFSGKEGALKGRLIGNTAQPFATDMGEVGNPGVLVGVGVTTKILGLNLSASYRGTFGSDDRTDQSAFVGFTQAF